MSLTDLEPWQLITANVVMALACGLQSVVGFGSALIAAPVLVLLHPGFVPGPLLLASSVLTLAMSVRDRHAIDRKGLLWALSGRVPGAIAGAALLTSFPASAMAPLFSGLILFAVALTMLGERLPVIRPRPVPSIIAGMLAGVMGTVTAVGGPPMALLYQHESGPTLRGTLSSFFTVGTIISMVTLATIGRFGPTEVARGLAITPGLLVGFASAGSFRARLDAGHTRKAVLWVCAFSAVLVLLHDC